MFFFSDLPPTTDFASNLGEVAQVVYYTTMFTKDNAPRHTFTSTESQQKSDQSCEDSLEAYDGMNRSNAPHYCEPGLSDGSYGQFIEVTQTIVPAPTER
jgi:hypothetical protein